jgi:iron complex transport system permease protein
MDMLARNIAQVEIPLGILTAIVGAPFFVALLLRTDILGKEI